MPTAGTPPVLELRDISRRFPGVLANDRVNLALARGEVLGVLGENGAGKSTLMNIISGLIAPDDGEIKVGGRTVSFASCGDAIAEGIGMVHQHFMLVPTLTVAENIVLGDPRMKAGRLRLEHAAARIAELAADIGLPVDPGAAVGGLDIGGQQRVEILKALYRDAGILILDEPTAVLSRSESAGLFAMIRRLAASGVSVLLISHKLDDIYDVCDRVVVMRQGRVVDAAAVADRDRGELVRAMVGEDIRPPARGEAVAPGAALLRVDGLAVRRDNGAPALGDVSFTLHGGEILALAGIEGNGQRELVEALTGLRPPAAGRIAYGGAAAPRRRAVRRLRRNGVRHVPEDRHDSGLLAALSLTENYLLSHFFSRLFNRFGWLRRRPARRQVAALIDEFDIRAPGPDAAISALSGGNQQKLVLARELGQDSSVLIAAHPTRGLDVRTIAFVQNALLERRRAGMGVLLVSSDLSEIWQIADRVMVAAAGRVRGPVAVAETTLHEVGAWMAGQ